MAPTAMVTTVSPEIVRLPPASLIGEIFTKEVKLFGFALKSNKAKFCSK